MFNLYKPTALLIVLLLSSALLLAGCGNQQSTDSSSEAASTPTTEEPTPTEEPAPTEEPTGEAITPAPEITETTAMSGVAVVTEEVAITATTALTAAQSMSVTGTATETAPVTLDLDVIQGPSMLASALIGYRIRNLDGDNIGEIEDVVVNMVDGHVLFVTMGYDGGLFQSAKTFPVPAGAFTWDAENEVLRLDVDEATLEEAPGFERDWPNMTAEGYDAQEYDAEVTAYWLAQFPELATAQAEISATPGGVAKVSDMIGLGVRNPQGENIGEISDIIINADRQQVSTVVIAFKGFRLIGSDEYVIPYAAFSLDVSGVDRNNPIGTPVLNITEDNLADAPPFDPSSVDLTDPNWSEPYQSWWMGMAEGPHPLAMTA